MANSKDTFVSNVGATVRTWHTNKVGPWRLSHHYYRRDGTKVRVETRWKGEPMQSHKRGCKDAWTSDSETREIVCEPIED